MLSADALVQANATLIVGVVFLVTLREALGLPARKAFLWFEATFGMFALSAIFSLNGEDAIIMEGYPLGSAFWLAKLLFFLGLALLVMYTWFLGKELQEKKK